MKKTLIIVSVIVCFIVGIVASGYIIVKRTTSDEAIKSRLLSLTKDFGETKIERAHMDLLEGIVIDNLSFTGTSEDVLGKSLKIPRIVLKHNLQSLLKGQLNISNAIVIAPELTIEKPTDIWSLLNTIKSYFDKTEMPAYMDILNQGLEIRDLKIHIKEDPQTNSPEIKLSGVDITFLPYAGSFKNIIIKGNIDDEFLGNYSFTMGLHPNIPSLDIEANAKNIMLNEGFLARFPYVGKMLWDNYKPTGKINVSCSAEFNNKDKQKKKYYVVNINLNGLEAMYEDWPFLIYNLNGDVELNTEKLYLKGIVGYIKSGDSISQAEFSGEFDLYGTKKTFVMTIPNLFVNQEFLQNIPISEFGEQVWSKIRPTGLVDLNLQYNVGEKEKSSCFLAVDCKDLEINPQNFPLPISHVNGQFKLCNNIILFTDTSGFIQCGGQSIFTEMNGVYDLKNERKIFNLHIPNLSLTESLLKDLPAKGIGDKLWTNLKPTGKVDIIANFQDFKEEKDNNYSIEINLRDCDMNHSKYNIFLHGIGGILEINKSHFLSKHIDAKCCGGHVEGALSVNLDTEPYQYEGELNFSRIILEELAQKVAKTEKQWSGLLYGRIKYRGSGTDPKNFYAEGQFNVNEGYLSDVPIILSVFNLLNLSLPKKESFHSAQAKFIVKDGIIHIDDGRIYSDSIELNGRGDISLNGDLHINVVTGFSRDFFSQIPIVGKLFDLVVGGVRKQLTMVEIGGTFLKPESHPVPFKPFTKSIKNMFELLPKDEHGTTTATKEKKK
ncbi:MAG: hypothetical protein HYV59_15405 [Planctomycetes bacterium]|nr:hypothetical protein [Planctomycetota bacterium]